MTAPATRPALGLGCSRIASLSTRPGAREIARLLDRAYDGGIRFFDTACLYGQGDSERRLAGISARPGTEICTKAGLALSASQPVIRRLKPVLRPVLLQLRPGRAGAAALRRRAEVSDLDPARLRASIEGSLRRLGRDHVALFLLHSPPLGALGDGRLYDLLDGFRAEGLAAATGVSCRSLADAAAVIASGRVQAVEIPLDVRRLSAAGWVLEAARASGVRVIAREVLTPALGGDMTPEEALRPLLAEPRLSVVLTGTTRAAHLEANLATWHETREQAVACT